MFSALCLNTRGLEAFVACKPFERLFKVGSRNILGGILKEETGLCLKKNHFFFQQHLYHSKYQNIEVLNLKYILNSFIYIVKGKNIVLIFIGWGEGLYIFKKLSNPPFQVLLSPDYLPAMRRRRSADPLGDTASNLGNAMDELMRHQPSLKQAATAAIIQLLEQVQFSF